VTPELKGYLVVTVVKMLVVFSGTMVGVMMVVWAERRVSGWIQLRLGPNRVGPFGLLQSVADGLKNILKEEAYPANADRVLFMLAPAIAFTSAMLLFAVVPFAAPLPITFDFTLPIVGQFVYDRVTPMVIADLPIGFLFIFAISSLGVYGIVLAGWASNSKYAFLGALRASSQMVSYEIALGMSLIVIMILVGTVELDDVIALQQDAAWLILPATFAFMLFATSALAETNRLPFDMPEAESELVSGYHTEYSAMKFSMFFIAEYASIITMSALMATLFFGGWDIPFTTWDDVRVGTAGVSSEPSWVKTLATLGVFTLKTILFVLCFIWIRWTLPRFRFDQVMALGWKVLLPSALVYIMVIATAVWALVDMGEALSFTDEMILFAINVVVIGVVLWIVDRGRLIVGSSAPLRARGGG